MLSEASMFKQSKPGRSAQRNPQAPRRVRRVSLAAHTRAAITAVGQNYVVDHTGRYITVFRLLGSEFGVVDDLTLNGHLKVLQDYLERTPDAIQRISASYLQPLDPYLAYLSACYKGAKQHAPQFTGLLQELADHMVLARDQVQARLGADYWVVTYSPNNNSGLRLPAGSGARSKTAQPYGAGKLPFEDAQESSGLWARLQRAQKAVRERALRELEEHCMLLAMTLKRAEIQAYRLQGQELVDLFQACWGEDVTPAPQKKRGAAAPALTTEQMEASIRKPTGLMELTASWACTAGGYMRSWYLRDFSGLLSPDMMSWLSQEPGVRVLQYCEQMPMAEARRVLRLNRTITASERYLRPQGDIPDYDWMAKTQSNDEVRLALSFKGEAVFRYRALIQQWAATEEELEERSRALLLSLQDRAQIIVHQATFRQDAALVSGLPLAHCQIEKPERNMDSKGLARLLYPSPRDPLHPRGVWMGMALPSKLLVTMDLFALQNPVVELVGIMGSGKSMTQKFLLTQLITQGYPGFVLDGAREYISTVEALNGTIIKLGSTHGPGFNPVHFDPLDESEEGDPFVVGQAFFLDWVEAALHTLSDVEKTVIGEAYLRALEHAGIKRADRATWERPRPLLSDVYQALMQEPGDPEMGYENPQILARKLAIALKPFALGVYAPLFNRPDQLVLGNEQLVCFDVYDVPDRLRLPFIHQLLAFIQRQTLRRYRYKGSVVVLDEGHLLLNDERSARIIEHLVRNGRKAGQLMLFTQHTHTDSQRNTSAQLAHKTAGATLVFRINRQDVATLDDLHLTPLEKQIVVEQNEGECLLVAPSGHVRLKVFIPPPWYARFTTKPGEVLARQQMEEQPPLPTAPVVDATPPAAEEPQPAPPLPVPASERGAARPLSAPWGTPEPWTNWERTLVGANQVAAEWLNSAVPGQHGARGSLPGERPEPPPQETASEERSPEHATRNLWLVWSSTMSEPVVDEKGGDAVPAQQSGNEASED
jgi:hypothetical protein